MYLFEHLRMITSIAIEIAAVNHIEFKCCRGREAIYSTRAISV